MKGSMVPSLSGTPNADGSQLDVVTRFADHVTPPSPLDRYVTSNSELPLQLRSLVMTSIRPLTGSMLISTLMRSPALGATIMGVLHWSRCAALAQVSSTCARPFTISLYATYSRFRTGSNAGAGYDPGPRNG